MLRYSKDVIIAEIILWIVLGLAAIGLFDIVNLAIGLWNAP